MGFLAAEADTEQRKQHAYPDSSAYRKQRIQQAVEALLQTAHALVKLLHFAFKASETMHYPIALRFICHYLLVKKITIVSSYQ